MSQFHSHRKLEDQVFMEIAGIEFEDFEVGQVFEHRPGRTFTAEENRQHTFRSADLFARTADAEYNHKVYGGENVISETLVLSAVTAMTTKTFNKVVANLGWTDVTLPTPSKPAIRSTPSPNCSTNASRAPARLRPCCTSAPGRSIRTARKSVRLNENS